MRKMYEEKTLGEASSKGHRRRTDGGREYLGNGVTIFTIKEERQKGSVKEKNNGRRG